jgi:hypothetical protein
MGHREIQLAARGGQRAELEVRDQRSEVSSIADL